MLHTDPRIAKLYEDVPPEGMDRLENFRKKFPYQQRMIDGREWRFIDSEVGERTLFTFAGGTTIAEVSLNSIEHFTGSFRVIAPDYPPIDNMQELLSGCITLLEGLGVNEFSAMGGSYGGWMLQSFLRQYSDRIDKAVISVVGPPNPENSKQLSRILPLVRILPLSIIRSLVNKTFTRLESNRFSDPDQLMIWALVKEAVFHRVQREDFVALMKRLVDQTENYSFNSQDLQDWHGKLLLLFGSEDPATPPEKREEMAQLYPQAEIIVLEGGEHGISFTHKEQYYRAIESFLSG